MHPSADRQAVFLEEHEITLRTVIGGVTGAPTEPNFGDESDAGSGAALLRGRLLLVEATNARARTEAARRAARDIRLEIFHETAHRRLVAMSETLAAGEAKVAGAEGAAGGGEEGTDGYMTVTYEEGTDERAGGMVEDEEEASNRQVVVGLISTFLPPPPPCLPLITSWAVPPEHPP